MAQSHRKVGIPLDKDELRDEIGGGVYVDPKTREKEVTECKRIWAAEVDERTGGRYKGVIQGYNNHQGIDGKQIVGPNGAEPWDTGDMRDTWTLCVVNTAGKIRAWSTFLPNADADEAYSYDDALADDVISGEISLREAKKQSQIYANHRVSQELEDEIEAEVFSDVFRRLR